MPSVAWNEKNMRYPYLVFPFVGATVAGVLAIIFLLFKDWASPVFFGAVATAVPIMITGGIHMDGFADTCDALSSHQDKAEKLQIMKDPHVGAFALIYVCLVMIIQLGAYAQLFLSPNYLVMVLIGFVLSRSLGALNVLKLPCAKKDGLAATFSMNGANKIVTRVLLIYIIVISGWILWIQPLIGAGLLVLLAGFHWLFRQMVLKQFGGITGDLAGFYIQLVEMICLIYGASLGGMGI
jgi:adenosylcobinamide-GDP ribazoletransferase